MAADGVVHQRAILDAALDCVICIDANGCITYFSPSAEHTFGYRAVDMIGRELAEVIVPPLHRIAHRRGLAHYLGTGESKILGQRLELTAMRSDGSEFPVELTVTRIASTEEPGFIGFVRDISERVMAEEELRAAGERIESIANEHASLRRVATLVARYGTAKELFAVVAEEVAHVLGVPAAGVVRYSTNGTATQVGSWGELMPLPVGRSWPLKDAVAAGVVWRTQRPASVNVADFEGEVATALLGSGLRFATGVPILVEGRLWGAMVVFESDRDAFPVEVVERLESFTELIATAVANATARADLLAARRRVIEAADGARERLTRDMHDGTQQRLVNSLINLQLAQQKWSSSPTRAKELVELSVAETEGGIEALRELAAGIHPAILSDLGLGAALDELAARLPIPVLLQLGDLEFAASLRASVYFFCSEALTNVVKHAAASSAWVNIGVRDGLLTVEVGDDGVGGAEIGITGSGLLGLKDRIGALDGTLELSSPHQGAGTTLTARIPLLA